MRETIKTAGAVIAFIMTADVMGFFLWALSGQTPAGNFFIGSLTAHLLRWILLKLK